MPSIQITHGQDWAPVGWSKKPVMQGTTTSTDKKDSLMSTVHKKFSVIDQATEAGVIEKVPLSLSLSISQARQAKKLTQAQVAKMINTQSKVIADYEAGKAVPASGILNKLSKALGTRLKAPKGKKRAASAAGA